MQIMYNYIFWSLTKSVLHNPHSSEKKMYFFLFHIYVNNNFEVYEIKEKIKSSREKNSILIRFGSGFDFLIFNIYLFNCYMIKYPILYRKIIIDFYKIIEQNYNFTDITKRNFS